MWSQTWSLAREWPFASDINALFTKYDRIFLELQSAPILHVTSACSRDNAVSFRGKNIEKVSSGFWWREPSKWNFRQFSKISNRYNSKPEIDFVTISTAFKNVWGTLNTPLKTFGQGRWKGVEFAEEKRSITSNEIFFGTLTSFISSYVEGYIPFFPLFYSMGNIVSHCAKISKIWREDFEGGAPKIGPKRKFQIVVTRNRK